LLIVTSGCANPETQSQAGSRDHLVGWFEMTKGNTIIPVFKAEETYYSVCMGSEIPFKDCPEGLEWAFTPSSMVGTKIGYDAASKANYIVIEDAQLKSQSEFYVSGEKRPITKTEKPSGLLDAKARRPRTIEDFLGWFQPVWFSGVRFEIRKEGDRYFSQEQEFSGPKPGSWKSRVEPREIKPLPDQLGFTGFDRKNSHRLVYNKVLKRFELAMKREKMSPSVVRMPLARLSAPSRPEGGHAPSPMVAIGIPSWH